MRKLATSSLIALGLALSGCGAGTENRGVESVYQPVVQRMDYVLDVNTSGDGLAAGEVTRVRGWLDSLKLSYGDRVSVDGGESGNTSTASQSVASLVASYGVVLGARAPVTTGAIAPGAIRVIVSRTTATVPSCAEQRENGLVNYSAATTKGYGCAMNASMAAMIANPEDLIQGRSGGSGVGRTSSVNTVNGAAINSYYDTISKKAGTVTTDSAKGK